MLAKFVLNISGSEYELRDDDLKNWDEIQCSYKRAGFDGVVRSFTSQFEFVNQAYRLLLSAYLAKGVNASARVSVLTLDNNWTYVRRFECPLDFSTVSWESGVFKINCLDNTLASLIKAKKSTKYEFAVGKDIAVREILHFDRVQMTENLVYGLTAGEPFGNTADLKVTLRHKKHIWVGNKGSEIVVGGVIDWLDDQDEDAASYLFETCRDVDVTVDYSVTYREDFGNATIVLGVSVVRNGETVPGPYGADSGNGGSIGTVGNRGWTFIGTFPSETSLNDYSSPRAGLWAKIGDVVWVSRQKPGYTDSGTPDYEWASSGSSEDDYFRKTRNGKITLSLLKGDRVFISAHPNYNGDVAVRICESSFAFSWKARGSVADINILRPSAVAEALLRRIAGVPVKVTVSDFDWRLASTYLLAAESARGLGSAKLYTSFAEFCDWMSAVFGYVYYIGEPVDGVDTVCFVHRSELFESDRVRKLAYCDGIKYNVDSSTIYSTINAGYDKQDYENINGRDEFNFTNTYTTGCTVSDKALSLKSKYRADCYGVEFAVQKRGEETTDNESDQDVFFVLCKRAGTDVLVDRSDKVEGTLSDTVFNGAFNPMACIRANAGYIGIQERGMTLAFASSTGNSDVCINGEPISSDIEIKSQIATSGIVEFSTDETDFDGNVGDEIEITDGGITYRGYIKEVSVKYARAEAAKYKLFVREVVQ